MQRAVVEWLGEDTEFLLESLTIEGDTVEVVLVGPGDPPSEAHLARSVEDALGHDVRVRLRWTVQQMRTASSD